MDRGFSKASFAVFIFLSLCAVGLRALNTTTKETLPCGRPKEVYYVVRAIRREYYILAKHLAIAFFTLIYSADDW